MRSAKKCLRGPLAVTCIAAAAAWIPLHAHGQEIGVSDIVDARDAPSFVPGELIVKFREGPQPESVLPALNAPGVERVAGPDGTIIYRFPTGGSGDPSVESTPGQGQFTQDGAPQPEGLESTAGADLDAIISQLEASGAVEYAEKNYIHQPFDEPPVPIKSVVPDDTFYDLQWHLKNHGSRHTEAQSPGGSNFPTLWAKTVGSSDIVVAVLDTGIDFDHPDMDGNGLILPGYDMIASSFIGNDGDGRDPDATDVGDAVNADECYTGSRARSNSWHGSHVAGISSSALADNGNGIASGAWGVRTLPVRVLGKCGGTTTDINDAILWSAGLSVPGVPDNPTPANVINMSLGAGIPCRASTQSVINQVVAEGVTVVVAAGNDARDVFNFSPGGCENVISVAAADARGHLVNRYSNFGTRIDILAAGGDVARNDNGDAFADGVLSFVDGGYSFYNGTSMAAPLVAGAAALLLSTDDTLSPAEIEDLLKQAARPRNGTQCPNPCGAGLLDVGKF